jgi:hypothetical protein
LREVRTLAAEKITAIGEADSKRDNKSSTPKTQTKADKSCG